MATLATIASIRQRAQTPAVLLLGVLLIFAWLRFAQVSYIHAQTAVETKPIVERGLGPKPVEVRPPTSQWLDEVAEFFRLPVVNVALIAIGLIGIFFEFKLPGTTFPGAVAAICFVLFFWA